MITMTWPRGVRQPCARRPVMTSPRWTLPLCAAFSVVVFVLSAVTTAEGASTTPPKPFRDLFVLDCTGALHILPQHDRLSAGISLSVVKRVFDRVAALVQNRAKCRCPNIPADDLARRFGLNFGSALKSVTRDPWDVIANKRDGDGWACQQDDSTSFTHTINDIARYFQLGVPDATCSFDRWERNEPCLVQAKLPHFSNTGIQVLLFGC
eukprot:Opistho-2@89935